MKYSLLVALGLKRLDTPGLECDLQSEGFTATTGSIGMGS